MKRGYKLRVLANRRGNWSNTGHLKAERKLTTFLILIKQFSNMSKIIIYAPFQITLKFCIDYNQIR